MTYTKDSNGHIGLSFLYHYYDDNLIPSLPLFKEKEYLAPSSLLHYDGVELLYVTAGQGTILINGISYPIMHGSFFVLFQHHITRIIPEKQNVLHVVHCKITHATYLFLLANPCCCTLSFGNTDAPSFLTFHEKEREKIDSLFRIMKTEIKEESPMKIYTMNNLIIEILGRADRCLNIK